ncbi:hypothetical protein DE146DRAFT_438351 [Phaeosphaeria sp. MPI-PUGE-AT-0046c]|nr:hypothetical protein DE146DRAFT_438351 [Phaeosphaeria sp. MPI-PUGE-AT-0046c]
MLLYRIVITEMRIYHVCMTVVRSASLRTTIFAHALKKKGSVALVDPYALHYVCVSIFVFMSFHFMM